MIDLPMMKRKMSFFLDRKRQRITLDTTASGEINSSHFDVLPINESSTIRSLVFHFHKNRIALLVDCHPVAMREIELNLMSSYLQMDEPIIKLVRTCQK